MGAITAAWPLAPIAKVFYIAEPPSLIEIELENEQDFYGRPRDFSSSQAIVYERKRKARRGEEKGKHLVSEK